MDDRPSYDIVVMDHGDRVRWTLLCDDAEVARGNVLLGDEIDLDAAFTHAFANANAGRLERERGA